ncbi:MAG TPA: hypothetical protein PKD83_12110 [Ignavibacteria bacterium]|nr:hypothetical protein [Ignavibacteria bacterium]
MNTANKISPVIIGSVTMTLIAIFPLLNLINVFCCAGIMAGGFVGVYTYWKQLKPLGLPLETKDGGMIGILSGILSAVFVTGFGLLISLFSDSNPILDVLNTFDEMGIQTPPEMLQYLDKFSNEFSEHGFSPTITLISFISNLILYPLFGSIGALIGVNYFNKSNKSNNLQIDSNNDSQI